MKVFIFPHFHLQIEKAPREAGLLRGAGMVYVLRTLVAPVHSSFPAFG